MTSASSPPTRERLAELCGRFAGQRIAVIGDLIADVYIHAEPRRLSREAPVMINRWEGESMIPGGAANAGHNLTALGATVLPVGVVGADREGSMLQDLLSGSAQESVGLVVDAEVATVMKTRIMLHLEGRVPQQAMRIDRESEGGLSGPVRERLRAAAIGAVGDADAVIISDYGYGVVDAEMVATVLAHADGKVVTADSRFALAACRGVTLVTPNHAEAEEMVGFAVRTDQDCVKAGGLLLERLGAEAVLLTRGNKGMALFQRDSAPVLIPASGRDDEVTDVSGAGDTVIATATLSAVVGATYVEAAHLANLAAGVVVTRLGAATCSVEELVRRG